MKGQPVHQDSFVTRHSFVVRIWREEGSADWQGWVQHTRSGESTVSRNLDELLTFVERCSGNLGGTAAKGLK
jgi:hypothetical protein